MRASLAKLGSAATIVLLQSQYMAMQVLEIRTQSVVHAKIEAQQERHHDYHEDDDCWLLLLLLPIARTSHM